MRGPLAEGTLVQLKTGGPVMTVEDIRRDGIVATVWFDGATLRRDGFHLVQLRVLVPQRLIAAAIVSTALLPDGWVAVPIEATPEMCAAIQNACVEMPVIGEGVWRAALKAAPTAKEGV